MVMPASLTRRIESIAKALRGRYGEPDLREDVARPLLDQLVHTLLSQKTTSAACHEAFVRLKELGDWEAIRLMPRSVIEEAIRPAGLAPQKSERLLAILGRVRDRFGECSLEGLREEPSEHIAAELSGLPGVGPKTVACVLLFGLGRGVLPVDTHVYRVTRRLGILAKDVPLARAQRALEAIVPAEKRALFHVSLYEHGRAICIARAPRCAGCCLARLCDGRTASGVGPSIN
jgi:endonuclease-3